MPIDYKKDFRKIHVVSDGSVEGTHIVDSESGEELLANSITWSLDVASGISKCAVTLLGVNIESLSVDAEIKQEHKSQFRIPKFDKITRIY